MMATAIRTVFCISGCFSAAGIRTAAAAREKDGSSSSMKNSCADSSDRKRRRRMRRVTANKITFVVTIAAIRTDPNTELIRHTSICNTALNNSGTTIAISIITAMINTDRKAFSKAPPFNTNRQNRKLTAAVSDAEITSKATI